MASATEAVVFSHTAESLFLTVHVAIESFTDSHATCRINWIP